MHREQWEFFIYVFKSKVKTYIPVNNKVFIKITNILIFPAVTGTQIKWGRILRPRKRKRDVFP